MEKAQKVRKTRQEFSRYPVVSMAKELFDWILDVLDERSRVLNFDPIKIFGFKGEIYMDHGVSYPKTGEYFFSTRQTGELFEKLKDIVNNEDGFEAKLHSEYINEDCCEKFIIEINII